MLSWAWTPLSPLTLTVDGGGSVITDSEYPCFVGADCELLTVGLLADQAGDIEITLTRVRGETPLELGTVTLSAAESVTPAPITGWAATDLLASDILIAVVHGASDLTRVVLSLGRRAA